MARASAALSTGTLRRRVEGYRDVDPDDESWPCTARLGARLWRGEEITAHDAEAYGRSGSLVSVLIGDWESAGYRIRRRRVDTPNHPGRKMTVAYRLDGGPEAAPLDQPRPRQHAAMTPAAAPVRPAQVVPRAWGSKRAPEVVYPRLGAPMSVRALALDESGGLVMHLRDDEGSTWQVAVTGWVAGRDAPPPPSEGYPGAAASSYDGEATG